MSEIEIMAKRLDDLMRENAELQKELMKIKTDRIEMEKYKCKIDDLESENKELRVINHMLEEQILNLKHRISNLERDLETLSAENKKYRREIAENKFKTSNHVSGTGEYVARPRNTLGFMIAAPARPAALADDQGKRDTSRYIFKNAKYNKRDLVYAVVKDYSLQNTDATVEEAKKLFPDYLQGSFGVFKTVSDLESEGRNEGYMKRFFSEPVYIGKEECLVCSEWNKNNIDEFVDFMIESGIEIKKVER